MTKIRAPLLKLKLICRSQNFTEELNLYFATLCCEQIGSPEFAFLEEESITTKILINMLQPQNKVIGFCPWLSIWKKRYVSEAFELT